MEKLPNEIICNIFMYMDTKQLYNLSVTSKKFFCLANEQNDYREFMTIVWNVYESKELYFLFIRKCQNGTENDLRLSFDMINIKGYLWRYLKQKLSQILKELHPVLVWSHLIECDRKIRTVGKCKNCTCFYVYSNSIMSLIKHSTALNYFEMTDTNISSIFSDITKKLCSIKCFL